VISTSLPSSEGIVALPGQFFAMTYQDRQWQQMSKVTTGEAGGIHASGKIGRYRPTPPSETRLSPVRSVVKGRLAAPTQRSGHEDLTTQ
jgi:hypothetical protein